ncbi:MAG: N-acetyltransferase [bacterium]|nr:N-acetyltransferase [bacterium]
MSCSDMKIRAEIHADVPYIGRLHMEAFGPGRFAKTAYRVREGGEFVQALSLVATDEQRLVGSIRFTQILIDGKEGALLLGPLAVFRDYSGHRCGLRLMNAGLDLARKKGYELALLVGDIAYYQKAGFNVIPSEQILMPGPVDMARMLSFELQEGALERYAGMVSLRGA